MSIKSQFYNFMPYHCCTNLTSASGERRKLGVRQFAGGVEIAQEMGISVLNIASDWPPEWVSSYSAEYAHAPASSRRNATGRRRYKACIVSRIIDINWLL